MEALKLFPDIEEFRREVEESPGGRGFEDKFISKFIGYVPEVERRQFTKDVYGCVRSGEVGKYTEEKHELLSELLVFYGIVE